MYCTNLVFVLTLCITEGYNLYVPRIEDITSIVISPEVADKLAWKHQLSPHEVVEAFDDEDARIKKTYGGRYVLYGRTASGRLLFVVLRYHRGEARIYSARETVSCERKFYEGR
ncbi:MAG: hypothetical protein COS94_06575 [Candidatus Hydrogenedentes bacterium CG07_land_8_20_14_0_80_42_17]|nr:MAG: hypothetical protein COS94_06575 [Candidatus Hydrogenedentes bacterium CG07_land_8_20_14_0_80_42_17]